MTATATFRYTEGPVAVPAHRFIAIDDTVAVAGETGAWVVGAIRPGNKSSRDRLMRVPAVLVTRVIGGRHRRSAMCTTSMWVAASTVTLTRKGNADDDMLASLGLGGDSRAVAGTRALIVSSVVYVGRPRDVLVGVVN